MFNYILLLGLIGIWALIFYAGFHLSSASKGYFILRLILGSFFLLTTFLFGFFNFYADEIAKDLFKFQIIFILGFLQSFLMSSFLLGRSIGYLYDD